jgi:short-subunit dehydrogenase
MRSLEGLKAVVTGAAGGIGGPVTRQLREAGVHVVGIDQAVCPDCDVTLFCDLADPDSLQMLIERLTADPPDILVNIAGIMCFGPHEDQATARLELCYRVNLLVPAALASAVAGPMRARGSGLIVNIGSVLGSIPYPWFAAYSSSKAGLAAFSQALRRELHGSGVEVTHVSPRAVRTPFNRGGVDRFLDIAGMKADDPETVARRIVAAIRHRKPHVSLGVAEKFYAALNALLPRVIDNGLRPQIAKARAEFSLPATGEAR